MTQQTTRMGDDLLERLEMFADHGAPSMVEAQELMSDALLEIRRLRAVNGELGENSK